MAKEGLNKIFLSASIPYLERNPTFYKTADVIAIRDAVRALATVAIPHTHLIWGGHPAITPLIRYVMNKMGADLNKHVTLYQSNFFKDFFPDDNVEFENIEYTQESSDKDKSLSFMRNEMIVTHRFSAGIFIGGMEGVITEYLQFKETQPQALILPIASTGAAAKIIYDDYEKSTNTDLLNDYAYMELFRNLLSQYL